MIDYNDCNDNNRYRGRRQSSLSSNSVCPYASDSFCEDDDDYNDDGQYFFWDGYHVQNENVELGDEDDDNDCNYNHKHVLLQQQMALALPSSSPPQADGYTGIDKKRFVSRLLNFSFIQILPIPSHTGLNTVQML